MNHLGLALGQIKHVHIDSTITRCLLHIINYCRLPLHFSISRYICCAHTSITFFTIWTVNTIWIYVYRKNSDTFIYHFYDCTQVMNRNFSISIFICNQFSNANCRIYLSFKNACMLPCTFTIIGTKKRPIFIQSFPHNLHKINSTKILWNP